jgi:hypothetical protein
LGLATVGTTSLSTFSLRFKVPERNEAKRV